MSYGGGIMGISLGGGGGGTSAVKDAAKFVAERYKQ